MKFLQFRCTSCGKQFEELVKEGELPSCPACGGASERSYSGKIYTATGKCGSACSGDCKTCGGCH